MNSTLQVIVELVDRVSTPIGQLGRNLKALEPELRTIAKTSGIAFAGLSAGIIKTTNDFSEFEMHIQKAGGNINATAEELDMFRKVAKDVGLQTTFSAKEAAEALFYLAGGSIDAAEAQAGLKEAAKIAATGELDLKDAVIAAGDAMSQFGIEAEDATKISDLFIYSTTRVQQTMPELTQALKQVSSTARQTGLSIEETTGFLNLFADSGKRGMEGGIALSNVLRNLTTNLDGDKGAVFEELGIQVFDASGNMRDMTAVILELVDKFQSMTDAQRLQSAETIFGARSARDFLTLVSSGSETIREYIDDLSAAAGVAADFNARVNEARSPLEVVRSLMEHMSLTVGESLTPVVRDLALSIQPVVEKIAAWIKENPELTKNIILGATAVAGLVFVLSSLGLMLIGVAGFFTALMSPVGIVILGIGMLIAVGWKLYSEWGATIEGLKRFWEGFKTALSNTWEGIKLMFQDAVDWIVNKTIKPLMDWIDKVKSAFEAVAKAVSKVASGAGSAISSAARFIIPGLASGGPVRAGSPYIVGERGPELFVPGASGAIVPNHALAGGSSINIYFSNNHFTDERFAEDIGDKIIRTLKMNARL